MRRSFEPARFRFPDGNQFQGGSAGPLLSMAIAFHVLLLVAIQVTSVHSFAPFISRPTFGMVRITIARRHRLLKASGSADDGTTEIDESEDFDDEMEPVDLPPLGMEEILTEGDLQRLTVPLLEQQLRLRGLKVGGRKQELIDRLLSISSARIESNEGDLHGILNDHADAASASSPGTESEEVNIGKDSVDVSEYLEDRDRGKQFKTASFTDAEFTYDKVDDDEERDDNAKNEYAGEVWGSDARIVDDYEGRKLVLDSLSHMVVEFNGCNNTYVSASVVATRDALKPFLAGQKGQNKTAMEDRLKEIQTKREQAHRTPFRLGDDEGLDEGDETGLYANVIERDYSDWGKYTVTGAQLSATEVQGVLLLSDVYGALAADTQALAEKIAFECQPVVVMVPDLFRGHPWKEMPSTPGLNENGQTYEEWRESHMDLRVSIDIRAAAACLRERYGVSAVVVWGTCYGGGRALEAAAGHVPSQKVHSIDTSAVPPPVNPMAAVAWYPTRYNASALFGRSRTINKPDATIQDPKRQFAVMGVFAGKDNIPGARPGDAAELKKLLSTDERVKDHLIKVFPESEHGFAHIGLGDRMNGEVGSDLERFADQAYGSTDRSTVQLDEGQGEVAYLLSTAFMETYSRVFLPTTGVPITKEGSEWGLELEMKDLQDTNGRDVREEIKKSIDGFEGEPLGGIMIDPTNEAQVKELESMLRSIQRESGMDSGPYKIEDTDDLETMYAKMKAADDDFEIF